MNEAKETPVDQVDRSRSLSLEAMGILAEVHRTYISQLERGLKAPTLGVIPKLSRALKTSASRIVASTET